MIKIGVNMYYLELIFFLVSVFQQQKLIKKDILKNYLVVNLLGLTQAMQKMVMIQIMRLVMCKHLLMNLKIKKQIKIENEMRLKVEKEMREKLEKELKDKNRKFKNLRNNQVTNNFGKILIKN